MRTHEAAPANDKRAQVDFCWNIHYVQMNNVYCDVMNNGSPLQAWRAGFREGVKMGLENGDVVDPNNGRESQFIFNSAGEVKSSSIDFTHIYLLNT